MITPAMVTAAARALCYLSSDACGVDREDNWKTYGEQFKVDAEAALVAAQAVAPLVSVPAAGHCLRDMVDAFTLRPGLDEAALAEVCALRRDVMGRAREVLGL